MKHDSSADLPQAAVAPRTSSGSAETQAAGESRVRLFIGVAVAALLILGGLLVWRANSGVNKVALASSAQPVTVVKAKALEFRPFRIYIGRLAPWVTAKVGPQLVSAYITTVLVRPGAVVKKGDVLATLDCRHSAAATRAVEMQAQAINLRQKAMADEAARTQTLLDGGFVSLNEVEQKLATSTAEAAQLEAGKAQLARSSVESMDCVQRAPFDGEVATRDADPGAFVHPGETIVSVVDRSIIRVTADAPETDFAAVAPGTQVRMRFLATKQDYTAVVSRRAPAVDQATRTVHFEVDVADPARSLPAETTAELTIDVGQPQPASAIPLAAAAVQTNKVSIFTVDGDVAHARVVPLLGEREGLLYLDPTLKPGTPVVLEGRSLLQEGDRVKVDAVEEVMEPSPGPQFQPGKPTEVEHTP